MDLIVFDFSLGVVACETVVGVYGRREIVHNIADGYFDIEGVGVARRALEFDGELARFPRFKDAACLDTQDPRPHEQKTTDILGVALDLKSVMEPERLTGFIEVD